jgi:hypothetical protein
MSTLRDLLDHELAQARDDALWRAHVAAAHRMAPAGSPDRAAAITAAYACGRLRGLQQARLMALYGPDWASHDYEHCAPLILEGEVCPQGCALVIHGPLLLE